MIDCSIWKCVFKNIVVVVIICLSISLIRGIKILFLKVIIFKMVIKRSDFKMVKFEVIYSWIKIEVFLKKISVIIIFNFV